MTKTTLAVLATGALGLTACTASATSPHLSGSPEAIAVSLGLPADIALVEDQRAANNKLSIPYEKLVLSNGLTVILHDDKSDPLVHVDVTYHVGSGREEIGKSGFAHFFEHMMFNGSANVPDEEHFRLITEAGGTLNGSTNTDRTNYFQTAPKNQLEKMLWLEADRMGFLLPAVTQQSFEVQRATVKNERGQRVDNQPYGLVGERVGEALYPEGHPYSWITIGYVEDLDRVNVNDLKAFFLRWYGPNNATLTIGGDFDREQTLEWVAKYFGSIPSGPDVKEPTAPTVTLDADRYISMEDRVSLPLLYKVWPTVHARHEDEAPLDVLMNIIGSGKTSLLYKKLVSSGMAVQANTSHGCQELACTFAIEALPNPSSGSTLADLEKVVGQTFAEFEQRGVEPDDLVRTKAQIRAGTIYGLESVSGKVSRLAQWETLFSNPNLVQAEIDRYAAVTAEDVMRVYHKYLKDKPAVILSVVPEGQLAGVAAPDTWRRTERTLPDYKQLSAADLKMCEAKDSFDRSIPPSVGEAPLVDVPDLWRGYLANGIEVRGTVNDETPTTTINLRIKAGQRDEALNNLGLASLTAQMMNESTRNSSNQDIANRLEKLGSTVRFGAGQDYTVMSIRSLTENLDATIAIAEEMLFEPGFAAEDFTRLRYQVIENIRSSKKDAGDVADMVRPLLLYGHDNAFAYPNQGLEATVSMLTIDDVRTFYRGHYSALGAEIVVVSDLPQAEIASKLDRFGGWKAADVETGPIKSFPELAAGTLYLVDKPNAAQSEIRITKRAMPYDATGMHFRSDLMAFPLGGAFNSRVNLNLREDKGYTYGARAGFVGNEYSGLFSASAGVRRDATADAISELLKEITTFATTGMTETELAFTKSSVGQRDARAYETPQQKVELISEILTYDLAPNYREQQKTILDNLTVTETQGLAEAQLQTDEMIIIVVGDKTKILPELEALGLPIVELDELARPIGDEDE